MNSAVGQGKQKYILYIIHLPISAAVGASFSSSLLNGLLLSYVYEYVVSPFVIFFFKWLRVGQLKNIRIKRGKRWMERSTDFIFSWGWGCTVELLFSPCEVTVWEPCCDGAGPKDCQRSSGPAYRRKLYVRKNIRSSGAVWWRGATVRAELNITYGTKTSWCLIAIANNDLDFGLGTSVCGSMRGFKILLFFF